MGNPEVGVLFVFGFTMGFIAGAAGLWVAWGISGAVVDRVVRQRRADDRGGR